MELDYKIELRIRLNLKFKNLIKKRYFVTVEFYVFMLY